MCSPKSAILVSASPVATGTTATATFGIGAWSLAVARTLTKKGGASTASCQRGFEGGTRPTLTCSRCAL